jgi:hypothetical protein
VAAGGGNRGTRRPRAQCGRLAGLRHRGDKDRRRTPDDQGGSGVSVRGLRDRTSVLVRPLAGIVLRRLAARPGKSQRYAETSRLMPLSRKTWPSPMLSTAPVLAACTYATAYSRPSPTETYLVYWVIFA